MKQRWPFAVLIILSVTILAVVVLGRVRRPEPTHQGKPLSYWLQKLDSPYYDAIQQGRAAFRAIGPAAVPYLVREARRERPFRTKTYCGVWERLPRIVQHCAPKAEPTETILCSPMAVALNELGPSAVPLLCQAYADNDWETQLMIDHAVKQNARKADGSVVPDLLALLEHTNSQVRAEAAEAVGQIPVSLGPHAHEAVPVLTRLLTDQDAYVREEASFTLWRFRQDTNTVSFLISEVAQTSDWRILWRILAHFQQMNEVAKPALPTISNVVSRSPQLRGFTPMVSQLDRIHFD